MPRPLGVRTAPVRGRGEPDNGYVFDTPTGTRTLLDLFEGREQQVVYVPFVSSRGSSFAADCGAGPGFMLTVFLRDGEEVYRTYSTTSRGVDHMLWVHNVLDLTPYGRQEVWEDSPPGWPQPY